jgi:hypothetical protein
MRNGNKEIFELKVNPKITTDDFREEILRTFLDPIEASNCYIAFDDKPLNYGCGTLESLNVRDGSVIDIGIYSLPPKDIIEKAQIEIDKISASKN